MINEVVSKNEGVWIDTTGATSDLVELMNASDRSILLSDFELRDSGKSHPLPGVRLAPGERTILWADDDLTKGEDHLPFKISSSGEQVALESCSLVLDTVQLPEMAPNESYSRYPDGQGDFALCRYATPAAENGSSCVAPSPPGLSEGTPFLPFAWPDHHPALPSGLAVSELALRPVGGDSAYIEIQNLGDDEVELTAHQLSLAPIAPGVPFPGVNVGEVVPLDGFPALAPGERAVIELSESQLAPASSSPAFEAVVTLAGPGGAVLDRVDFMQWPLGATLARPAWIPARLVFCQQRTPGRENACTMLASRDVGNRVRALRTIGDFEALAKGSATLGQSSVKFVVDLAQENAVHFLSTRDWALHYTFIREEIYGEPALDRCDKEDEAAFNAGWQQFSRDEYFNTTGRKFHLGTLTEHGATGHHTVEHAVGDAILATQMREAFFATTARVISPPQWATRPQDESQTARAREIDGTLPLLTTNAPFADLQYQPLTHGVGYGILKFVPASELNQTGLGAQAILVTDDVPNDIPLVGGLITQAFQTPLAHINVLSQSRGTPNMALRNAVTDKRITEFLGKLVRLEVWGSDFSITLAKPEEAAAFWRDFTPSGPKQTPRLDLTVTELVDLSRASLADIPSIGAKAAQMAELYKVRSLNRPPICQEAASYVVPPDAFAVPIVHFTEHFRESGASQLYDSVRRTDAFINDPLERAASLEQVRDLLLKHPVKTQLLAEVTEAVEVRFGDAAVRFRSSSNAEDLPGFNGAGLYTSVSVALGDKSRSVEDGLRTVWASLFNSRAYDEREFSRVDHAQVAMGVLIHPGFPEEAANGVGVSRNITDLIRGDTYFLNSQAGEASVTNPAPGVTTEALEFQWPGRPPLLSYQSVSSLTAGEPVLTPTEAISVACALYDVQAHFRPLLDPMEEDPWFAMEIEYKLLYPSRELVIKQARPHAFSGFEIAGDCREF